MPSIVQRAFFTQAASCRNLGSPFTATVCLLLSQQLDVASRFGRRILAWPTEPVRDALALRAVGALNALARSGRASSLSALYPPNVLDEEALRVALSAAIAQFDDFLHDYLDSPPQTNEVARSSVLLGGALLLCADNELTLSWHEIGASAGLNLLFDQYRYELSPVEASASAGGPSVDLALPDAAAGLAAASGVDSASLDAAKGATMLGYGDPYSPVLIRSHWEGELPPLTAAVRVHDRQGCDVSPLRPASADARARLLAYIWPDQTERLARTKAALDYAAQQQPKLDAALASQWVPGHFERPLQVGTTRVLAHTIVWQYLPESERRAVEAAVLSAASRATPDARVAWLGVEADRRSAQGEGASVRLRLWPGDHQVELARADFHGRWVRWLPRS